MCKLAGKSNYVQCKRACNSEECNLAGQTILKFAGEVNGLHDFSLRTGFLDEQLE